MSKYLIHACPKRLWYVTDYLVPSMIEQGINDTDIIIYNDEQKLGNLGAYLDSAKLVMNEQGGTWHLQDDVLIASNFKAITEQYDMFSIVSGFCNSYSNTNPGFGSASNMWYSFPCMHISNTLLKEFVEWMKLPEIQNNFKSYIEAKKFDDSFFRSFLLNRHSKIVTLNIAPNIVENVDYLLGGSLANVGRSADIDMNAKWFDEPELVEKLKLELDKRQ